METSKNKSMTYKSVNTKNQDLSYSFFSQPFLKPTNDSILQQQPMNSKSQQSSPLLKFQDRSSHTNLGFHDVFVKEVDDASKTNSTLHIVK